MRAQRQSTSGFSLTELLAAISIIGILSSIALPNYTQSVCKSKQAEAIKEVVQKGLDENTKYLRDLKKECQSRAQEFGVET